MNKKNKSTPLASNLAYSYYSADHLPENERFHYWVNTINKLPNSFEINSSEKDNFQAHAFFYVIQNFSYLLFSGSSPLAARLSPARIAKSQTHPYQLLVKLSGTGKIRQAGYQAELHGGDVILIDTKKELESDFNDSEFIILTIPVSLIKTWIPDPENYVGLVMHSEKGWSSTLVSFLRQLTPEHLSSIHPNHYHLIIENILSIYVMALDEISSKGNSHEKFYLDKKNYLFERIYLWLSKNYMDTEICVDKIANELGISKREVHRQFKLSHSEFFFSGTLQTMRLEAAMKMLKDPTLSEISISEIGYRAGFSDPAYFGRVFKEKTSCSPGMYAKRFRLENALKVSEVD